MIIKTVLGIALAAMITGGASLVTNEALQYMPEQDAVEGTASVQSGFDANFVTIHSSF